PQSRFTLGAAQRPQAPQLPQLPPLPWHTIGRWAAIAGVASIVVFGAWWLWTGSTFRVGTVIVLGTQVGDVNAVAAAANVQHHSIITLDTKWVASCIEGIPGVHSATVHRDWPRSVVIAVEEDQAWGYWQAAGIRSEIDAGGHVLDKARPPAPNAPTIYESAGT